jgi:hypothetical protein
MFLKSVYRDVDTIETVCVFERVIVTFQMIFERSIAFNV